MVGAKDVVWQKSDKTQTNQCKDSLYAVNSLCIIIVAASLLGT